MKEVWKQVPDFEGIYEVSNIGRVRSLDKNVKSRGGSRVIKGRMLQKWTNRHGYYVVSLWHNQNRKHYLVHRLVAFSFIVNNENKKEVNHIDGNKKNNIINNLEWATRSENAIHSMQNKLQIPVCGEKSHFSKVKEIDVIKIRELYPEKSQSQIAKLFDTTSGIVHCIVHRKTWKHI